MARGGRQPGAGRPKGTPNLPRFSDYVTEEQRIEFAAFMHETYMGDMGLAKWYGDNAFAPQPKTVSGPDGGPIQLSGVEITIRK